MSNVISIITEKYLKIIERILLHEVLKNGESLANL